MTKRRGRPRGSKDKRPRKKRSRVGYAVYYSGRRTASLTDAYDKKEAVKLTSKNNRRAGSDVVEVRKLTHKEVALARQGKWVMTRPTNFDPSMRGYGPKSKAYKQKYEQG